VPRLCELYPGICLTTEEKARKNLSIVNTFQKDTEYFNMCYLIAWHLNSRFTTHHYLDTVSQEIYDRYLPCTDTWNFILIMHDAQ